MSITPWMVGMEVFVVSNGEITSIEVTHDNYRKLEKKQEEPYSNVYSDYMTALAFHVMIEEYKANRARIALEIKNKGIRV